MEQKKTDIVCFQETHQTGNNVNDIRGTQIFYHGPPSDPDRSQYNGSMAIALNSTAIAAWKRAGSPDPIYFGIFGNTTRIIALDITIA
jgi:exonuclease III